MEPSFYNVQNDPNSIFEKLDALVRRIFSIDDVTIGRANDGYLVRYRGHLVGQDSAAAYDQLAGQLKPLHYTPLFRWDGAQQVILIVQEAPKPKPSNPWINVLLGVLTLISVMFVGGTFGQQAPLPTSMGPMILAILKNGWPFTVSLLAILSAHEFGHYFVGRYHGVQVSLPYFIPMPLSSFGTMGAFINMKEVPKNKRILLDIGIAGPLAGLAVTIPVLLIGLGLSTVGHLPASANPQMLYQMEGNSILYLLAKLAAFGKLLPAPISYGSTPPVLYWLQYFFTGTPTPWGALDVNLSPVAWAGWIGLLVTSLNLLPVGMLDGGHIFYTLFGREKALKLYPFILVALVALGFASNSWWLWAFLLFLFGRVYAEPLDQITELDPRRRKLAWLALIILILTFTPVPLMLLV